MTRAYAVIKMVAILAAITPVANCNAQSYFRSDLKLREPLKNNNTRKSPITLSITWKTEDILSVSFRLSHYQPMLNPFMRGVGPQTFRVLVFDQNGKYCQELFRPISIPADRTKVTDDDWVEPFGVIGRTVDVPIGTKSAWNARFFEGNPLPPGTYQIQLVAHDLLFCQSQPDSTLASLLEKDGTDDAARSNIVSIIVPDPSTLR